MLTRNRARLLGCNSNNLVTMSDYENSLMENGKQKSRLSRKRRDMSRDSVNGNFSSRNSHADSTDDEIVPHNSSQENIRVNKMYAHSDDGASYSKGNCTETLHSRASAPGAHNSYPDFGILIDLMQSIREENREIARNSDRKNEEGIKQIREEIGEVKQVVVEVKREVALNREEIVKVKRDVEKNTEGIKKISVEIVNIKEQVDVVEKVAREAKQISMESKREAKLGRSEAVAARKITDNAVKAVARANVRIISINKSVNKLKIQGANIVKETESRLVRTENAIANLDSEIAKLTSKHSAVAEDQRKLADQQKEADRKLKETRNEVTLISSQTSDGTRGVSDDNRWSRSANRAGSSNEHDKEWGVRSPSRDTSLPRCDRGFVPDSDKQEEDNCVPLRRTDERLERSRDSATFIRDKRDRQSHERHRDRFEQNDGANDTFDFKHYLSVQNIQTYKENNNSLHPKTFMSQFEGILPLNWSVRRQLNFICGYLQGSVAEHMRTVAAECTSFEQFKSEFLGSYWSTSAQERIRDEISFGKDMESAGFKDAEKFFESLVKKNRFLDNKFTDREVMRYCFTKLPVNLQRGMIGKCDGTIHQFVSALKDAEMVECRVGRNRKDNNNEQGNSAPFWEVNQGNNNTNHWGQKKKANKNGYNNSDSRHQSNWRDHGNNNNSHSVNYRGNYHNQGQQGQHWPNHSNNNWQNQGNGNQLGPQANQGQYNRPPPLGPTIVEIQPSNPAPHVNEN